MKAQIRQHLRYDAYDLEILSFNEAVYVLNESSLYGASSPTGRLHRYGGNGWKKEWPHSPSFPMTHLKTLSSMVLGGLVSRRWLHLPGDTVRFLINLKLWLPPGDLGFLMSIEQQVKEGINILEKLT